MAYMRNLPRMWKPDTSANKSIVSSHRIVSIYRYNLSIITCTTLAVLSKSLRHSKLFRTQKIDLKKNSNVTRGRLGGKTGGRSGRRTRGYHWNWPLRANCYQATSPPTFGKHANFLQTISIHHGLFTERLMLVVLYFVALVSHNCANVLLARVNDTKSCYFDFGLIIQLISMLNKAYEGSCGTGVRTMVGRWPSRRLLDTATWLGLCTIVDTLVGGFCENVSKIVSQ